MRTDLRVLVRLATQLFVDGPTTMWLLLGARISLGTQPSPLAYIALRLLLQRSYARWNRWRAIVSGFASSCKRRFNGTRGTRFGSLYGNYQRPRLSDATSFKCARLILRQQGFSALRPRSQWLRLLWPVPVAECVRQADCRSGYPASTAAVNEPAPSITDSAIAWERDGKENVVKRSEKSSRTPSQNQDSKTVWSSSF